MKSWLDRIPVKIGLFLPIFLGIFISILILTILTINKSRNVIIRSTERNLTLEINTIIKMFERERKVKLENVNNDLKVAKYLFNSKDMVISKNTELHVIENQFNGKFEDIPLEQWTLDGKTLPGNNDLVDLIYKLTGSTATIFQKTDSGFVRISTNVKRTNGQRALLTFIPNWSFIVKEIEEKKTYIGRAFVVNDWYITAYEPIIKDDKVIGMLYVGRKEKDLDELRTIINKTKLGNSGFVFVFDEYGNIIIHPDAEKQNWKHREYITKMIDEKSGIETLSFKNDKKEKIAAFNYYPGFKLYVAAVINVQEETAPLVRSVLVFSVCIALFFIILLSYFMYKLTKKNIHNYLLQLASSDKQLKSTTEALQRSETQFQTLFNNTSDDIFVIDQEGKFLEVNQSACSNLGYSRDELLKKRFSDIKTPAFANSVRSNLDLIRKMGIYQYESEHISKSGTIIPVEMKSRSISYKGKDAILTIARDITERKKVEQKIITTILETEERERKRFSADLHDGLAPILSTIKLYTDLLIKGNMKKINTEEAVGNIDELVDQAMVSAREISNNIRPSVLQDFGLATAITDFCTYINKTKSIKISLITNNYHINKRGIEEAILYQAAKELINNTIKHSGANNIMIDLKSNANQVILYYRDDGSGFDFENMLKEKRGLGLNNIINKIKTIRGNVDFNSSFGKGMFVIITIKIDE